MRDAFFESVEGRDGIARDVLPSAVLETSLVNAAAGAFQRELGGVTQKPPAPGQLRPEVMTHLSDPRTGFSAGITYDPDRREVVIAFSGLGSSRMTARQALRTAMNWLGFIPKNMSQASKLTRLVKQHIDEVNRSLPEGQKLKLTLTGHSMGGGLASYAALRNQVPGVVTNPMRLGWGARARIGQSRLVEADKYLTEVVVQGDWVADNHAAKLYMPLVPVFNVRGPLGHARRFMVPNYQNRHAHNDIPGLLQSMARQERRLRMARNVLPHLQQTSPRARGDMVAGNGRASARRGAQTGHARRRAAHLQPRGPGHRAPRPDPSQRQRQPGAGTHAHRGTPERPGLPARENAARAEPAAGPARDRAGLRPRADVAPGSAPRAVTDSGGPEAASAVGLSAPRHRTIHRTCLPIIRGQSRQPATKGHLRYLRQRREAVARLR
jgi:Lipase (class 3)